MFNLTYLKQKKFEFLHATTKTEQRQQIPPQNKSLTKKNLISKNIKNKIVAFLCVLWCCLQKQPQQLCFAFISVFIFLSLQGLFLSLSLSFSTANNLNLFKSLSLHLVTHFLFLFLFFIFTTLLWILLAKCGALVFFFLWFSEIFLNKCFQKTRKTVFKNLLFVAIFFFTLKFELSVIISNVSFGIRVFSSDECRDWCWIWACERAKFGFVKKKKICENWRIRRRRRRRWRGARWRRCWTRCGGETSPISRRTCRRHCRLGLCRELGSRRLAALCRTTSRSATAVAAAAWESFRRGRWMWRRKGRGKRAISGLREGALGARRWRKIRMRSRRTLWRPWRRRERVVGMPERRFRVRIVAPPWRVPRRRPRWSRRNWIGTITLVISSRR